MDNDAINSLTKKWTANLVYLFCLALLDQG